MICLRVILLLLVLSCSIVPAAHADTLTVRTASDSGPGSLREALDRAEPGTVITFDSSLAGQRIALTTGPLIVRVPLTLDASDLAQPLTLDGQGQQRILTILSAEACALLGLRFEGGQADTGGAIGIGAGKRHLFLRCTFSRNSALEMGGAIFAERGSGCLAVTCSFERNTARVGGAIYLSSGELEVRGSTFTENEASGNGGAIYVNERGELDYIFIARCTFTANQASRGGALCFEGSSSSSPCIMSTFTRNKAHGSAGAAIGGNYTDCTFIDNSCLNGNGGALEQVGFVRQCTFTGNRANGSQNGAAGGAIFTTNSVDESHFENNSALEGGALAQVTRVWDCTFRSNSSMGGGAVARSGTVLRCRFEANRTSGQFSAGGAVYRVESVDSCYFARNEAGSSGGAVCRSESVANCYFVDNRSERDGGAVALAQNVLKNTFVRNRALGNGGAVAGGRVIGCYFSGNQAELAGGALYEPVLLFQSTLVQNQARGGGGLACVPKTSVFNSILADNVSSIGPPNVAGEVRSWGGNLVGAATGSTGWGPADRVGLVNLAWIEQPCDSMTLLVPAADNPARSLGRDTLLNWICKDLCGRPRRSACIDAGALKVSDCPPSGPVGMGFCDNFVGRARTPGAGLGLRAWPNPTDGWLEVEAELAAGGELQLTLLDGVGRIHLQRQERAAAGRWAIRLDLGPLPAGLYALRLHTAAGGEVVRVLRR